MTENGKGVDDCNITEIVKIICKFCPAYISKGGGCWNVDHNDDCRIYKAVQSLLQSEKLRWEGELVPALKKEINETVSTQCAGGVRYLHEDGVYKAIERVLK